MKVMTGLRGKLKPTTLIPVRPSLPLIQFDGNETIKFDVNEFTNNKLNLENAEEYVEDLNEVGVSAEIVILLKLFLTK